MTEPGTTLTFTHIKGSSFSSGVTLTKNGPGTLLFGVDGVGGDTFAHVGSIDTLIINQGSYLNVPNDLPQLNLQGLAPAVPALVLGDGATLGCKAPLAIGNADTEQVVRYIGTNTTAVITDGLFSGPREGSGTNTKSFDIDDGAAEIDLHSSANFLIYPSSLPSAVSNIRKSGAGTLKLSGTASRFRGSVTILNGRIIAGGNVPSGGFSVLGDASSVVQLADADTALANDVALVFDGGYTFSRGICVNPYGRSATIGNISTAAAVFDGAILLSNTVQLTSASVGVNATLFNGVISGLGALTKTGVGTVVLVAANTYTGTTSVAEGTLRLAAAERIADSSALRLTGGTFDTAGFSETLDTLDVDGDAVLDFGSGSCVLHFAASAALNWDGTLTLQNWTNGSDQLFVGTDDNGLTPSQLEKILAPNGQPARQLATGEVVPILQGTLIIVR